MALGSIFLALNIEVGKLPVRVQLLPVGPVVKGRDGRTWLMSDPDAVLLATAARGVDLAVDVNHSTDLQAPLGADAPAVGWISKLSRNEAGEIWGDVEWTEEGKSLILSRAYRYISPVFAFDESSREIQALIGAGLTNRPNLALPALNRESTPAAQAAGIKEDTLSKNLCAALGLAETATEEQQITAINALKAKSAAPAAPALAAPVAANAQGVDLTLYAPRADLALMEQRAINAEKKLADRDVADLRKRAEAAVDGAIKDRKIAPASKEAYLAMCASEEGLKQFETIAKATASIIPAAPAGPEGTPPAGAEAALNAEELEQARNMGYTPDAWKKIKEAAK